MRSDRSGSLALHDAIPHSNSIVLKCIPRNECWIYVLMRQEKPARKIGRLSVFWRLGFLRAGTRSHFDIQRANKQATLNLINRHIKWLKSSQKLACRKNTQPSWAHKQFKCNPQMSLGWASIRNSVKFWSAAMPSNYFKLIRKSTMYVCMLPVLKQLCNGCLNSWRPPSRPHKTHSWWFFYIHAGVS